jgi:AI-2 transport protein TqsA
MPFRNLRTLLVLLTTIFVLFEALVLPDKIRDALGDPQADLSRGIAVVGRIKAYVVIKTFLSLATGAIIGGVLHLMGVDFALLWGLLAFLLNFIPNIGSIIAAVPAILLALVQIGPTGAVGTAVVFIVVNMVIGNLIEPKVLGQSMNLSPLVVFVSLVFWGWLWGGVGMLLSVPLTMAIRIMLEGNVNTRPFAVLMAGHVEPVASPHTERSPKI